MPVPFADLQELNQTSALVELFALDATALGGDVHYFTNHLNPDGSPLTFNEIEYAGLPVQSDGWDISATGSPPRPTLTVGNSTKLLLNAVISLGDLVGAKLTRIRTYSCYLDDGETPDTGIFIGPDIYIVEQKTHHDNVSITWQLSSILDRFGMMLPRRQVLKDKGFPGVSRTRITG